MKTFIRALETFLYAMMLAWALILVTAVNANAASTEAEIKEIIVNAAVKHGVDPSLAVAIATLESNLNPRAVGKLGEVGVFQLRPEYHRVSKGNVKQNVNVAVKYLAYLKRACSHYGDAYFICFNLGQNYKRLNHPTRFYYYKLVSKIKKRNELNHVVATTD